MQALIVVTSATRLDDTHPTGVWLDEYATIYVALCEAGVDLTVASPAGAAQRRSIPRRLRTPARRCDGAGRWRRSRKPIAWTRSTPKRSTPSSFPAATVHSWTSRQTLAPPVSPAPLRLTDELSAPFAMAPRRCWRRGTWMGSPLVRGRKVTGFTNGEEAPGGAADGGPVPARDTPARRGRGVRARPLAGRLPCGARREPRHRAKSGFQRHLCPGAPGSPRGAPARDARGLRVKARRAQASNLGRSAFRSLSHSLIRDDRHRMEG